LTVIASLELTEHITALRTPYTAAGDSISSWVTHYGENFNGRKLGCSKLGYYASDDPSIVAVSPERAAEMPCGTLLEVCGPGGCQVMARKDTCPGCSAFVFDLSEAGIDKVCGVGVGVCRTTVTKVAACENFSLAMPQPAPLLVEPPDEATQLSYLLTPEVHAPVAAAPAAPVCSIGGIAVP
jgi:hypothetical protein